MATTTEYGLGPFTYPCGWFMIADSAKAPIFQIMQIKNDGPFPKVRDWYRQFYNPREEAADQQAKMNGKYYTPWLEQAAGAGRRRCTRSILVPGNQSCT